MTRREFLAAGAAAAGAAVASADDSSAMPIIDPHQHLWDLSRFKLPWITKDSPLNRSYLLDDYRKATEGLKVVKTVYMEVDVAPEQQDAEADYVLELCRKPETKMAGAVISGRPADADAFAKYMARFKDNKSIKGVRQVLHGGTPAGFCLQDSFVKSVRLLGTMGKSFDLCLRHGDLLDGAKLIDLCPETRFVLDHCGNADVQAKDRTKWQKDIAELAKRKNVVGKVSGILATAKPGAWTVDDVAPIIKHTLDVFGPDRVLFAGDWPVCTLGGSFRQWVEAVRAVVKSRPEAEQRKLFHDNAAKFYAI